MDYETNDTRLHLWNRLELAVDVLLGLENRVEGGVEPNLAALLTLAEDVGSESLLLGILLELGELEVGDADLRVSTVLVPVPDGEREDVVKVVDEYEVVLVPVRVCRRHLGLGTGNLGLTSDGDRDKG